MDRQNRPIGFFDSGLGGISVLRACTALLPREDFLYFGDSVNAPYGEKTLDQVRDLTIQAIEDLIDQGVKAVVVACNTATSAAIALLRDKHPNLPIIGIEPAVKPAAQAQDSSSVLVMATPLTIPEDKYQKLAAAFCDQANVISLPCKGLAELVEQGHMEDEVIDDYLQTLFLPFRHCSVEYIVLGCTHYPFVRSAIRKNFGRPVDIIDGSDGTARQLKRQLEKGGLLTPRESEGQVTFLNSRPEMVAKCWELYNLDY
ncbi:MAG: glutamate racemase [Ruminiclostridium sp.]|nr:glutamate racemase [Ruminiclostridium sp.]